LNPQEDFGILRLVALDSQEGIGLLKLLGFAGRSAAKNRVSTLPSV